MLIILKQPKNRTIYPDINLQHILLTLQTELIISYLTLILFSILYFLIQERKKATLSESKVDM